MNEQTLIDSLAAACGSQPPNRADVLALRPFTLDDVRARASRFLGLLEEANDCAHDRANVVPRGDRTLVQLANGARAAVYHASGALQFHAGASPFQAPFARVEERAVLTRMVAAAAQRLHLEEWAGDSGSLQFERLFQSKGQGADRDNRIAEPVLFRATGAWRHAVGGIPVLGAASVALTLSGDGRLDALAIRIRPGVAEKLDSAAVVAPEVAARHIAANLASVLGNAKDRLPSDVIASQTMRFGYLDLGKRKVQRVLAPVYVAQIVLRHRLETQAYVFAVPATDRSYLALPLFGTEAVTGHARTGGGRNCRDLTG